MKVAARLLAVEGEAEARRECLEAGAEPDAARRLAGAACARLVRIDGLPPALAVKVLERAADCGAEAAEVAGGEADGAGLIIGGELRALRGLAEVLGGAPETARLGARLDDLFAFPPADPPVLVGRHRRLVLDRPRIMGVLNVTPDSFSDGGRYRSAEDAVAHAREMAGEGADIIDVGGESTRPGALPVAAEEEAERVVPVIERLRRELDLPLSVDTTKSSVARAALAAGADFVNDISGLEFDRAMAATVAEGGGGLFLMHTRGRPDHMQQDTAYRDLLGEVIAYLRGGLARARAAGLAEEQLAVDPGIGFGKDLQGNLEILRRLRELAVLGRPILLGTSRKSFIGKVLQQPAPEERLCGTLATVALGVREGAHIFRVHDVRPALETARMAWAICRGESPETNQQSI